MFMELQAVPLPMTAVEKFGEAVYFYKRMCETAQNVKTFPYNLSAFLTALRSTIDYLCKQFHPHPRFKPWIDAKLEELRNDQVMAHLTDLRNEAVHRHPIDRIYVRSGPRMPDEGIVTTHLEIMCTTDDEGNIQNTYKIGKDGPEVNTGSVVQWIFRLPEEIEVFISCSHGLKKIQSVLEEWDQILAATST